MAGYSVDNFIWWQYSCSSFFSCPLRNIIHSSSINLQGEGLYRRKPTTSEANSQPGSSEWVLVSTNEKVPECSHWKLWAPSDSCLHCPHDAHPVSSTLHCAFHATGWRLLLWQWALHASLKNAFCRLVFVDLFAHHPYEERQYSEYGIQVYLLVIWTISCWMKLLIHDNISLNILPKPHLPIPSYYTFKHYNIQVHLLL